LTLFVRGWKKWLNKGAGIFTFDEISIVGPAPEGFQAPNAQVAQAASVSNDEQGPADEMEAADETSTQMNEPAGETVQTENAEAEADTEMSAPQMESSSETENFSSETPADMSASPDTMDQEEDASPQAMPSDETGQIAQAEAAQLPVSGLGSNDSLPYVLMISVVLLLVLLVGAITATLRQRNVAE
jgi:cobalamin biosynthesis Mg chelatase CobN